MAKKQKVRTIIKKVEVVPKNYEVNKVKSEIKQLETKKADSGTGVRGFLRRLSINKQINERRGFIANKDKLRNVKAQTELGKAMVDRERARAELNEIKKKSQVNFDSITAQPEAKKATIIFDDLYR